MLDCGDGEYNGKIEVMNAYFVELVEKGAGEPTQPEDPEKPENPEEPGEGVEENVMIFAIYPNPVENNLTIDTDEVITEINIYSITGVLVYSETSVSDNVINVSDLNNGIYFIF